MGWNVKGTGVNGNGTLICEAAAVSAVTNNTDATRMLVEAKADSAPRLT